MTADPFASHSAGLLGVGADVAPITPAAGDLTDPEGAVYVARALFAETAGLATIKTPAGNTRTGVPISGGGIATSFGAARVTAFSGTNLWGVK